MAGEQILVVDDLKLQREFLKELLHDKYKIQLAASGAEALRKLEKTAFDLVLTDLRMPKMDGIGLIEHIKKITSDPPEIIVITAHGEIETAVEAVRLGAYSYLEKTTDTDVIELEVEQALERSRLVKHNKYLQEELERTYFKEIIGRSGKMQEVYELIEMVAPKDTTVMIVGETGTGKELVARAIHKHSTRKDKMFVPINCAALSENLLESELFGHEKGAYTGAYRREIGRFEYADGGTIFLDEVAEIDMPTQVKLLRVLQEGEFQRVGNNETIRTDTRVIAATNVKLEEAIKDGKLREDLYYRLNVVAINVPPLKERKEDIELLVSYFLDRYGPDKRVSPAAVNAFRKYDWPGNVRELENIIERACVLCKADEITLDYLPDNLSNNGKSRRRSYIGGDKSLDSVEAEHIDAVLLENSWNISRSAETLGIDRTTLYNKIKRYGLNQVVHKLTTAQN